MSSLPIPTDTDAELEILRLLWETAPLTVRQITKPLYPACKASDVATVQKLIQRLENKKLVTRDRSAHAHQFSPSMTQHEFAGAQLSEMADKLSEGSLTPLLVHLVESERISAEDRLEIRKLLSRHSK